MTIQNNTHIKRKALKGRKKVFMDALLSTLGNVTQASKISEINRDCHYVWKRTDPNYVLWLEELKNVNTDFADSCLKKAMKNGNAACIIFYHKAQLGWQEKQYVEHKVDQINQVSIKVVDPTDEDAIEKIKADERKKIMNEMQEDGG